MSPLPAHAAFFELYGKVSETVFLNFVHPPVEHVILGRRLWPALPPSVREEHGKIIQCIVFISMLTSSFSRSCFIMCINIDYVGLGFTVTTLGGAEVFFHGSR